VSSRAGPSRPAPSDRLLDVREAAAMLGLKSPRTLYKRSYASRVPSVKIGRLLRFRRSDLEQLIADGERPALATRRTSLTARRLSR
jgi:excisionase family DNA binding protein